MALRQNTMCSPKIPHRRGKKIHGPVRILTQIRFPLPFPLPPGRKCRPSPWAGLHFAQGGGGMGGGIAPGLPLRIPKMRHPRKLRKTKLHIIYLKGTHKKAGPKKKTSGLLFWYRGVMWGVTLGIDFGTGGGTVGVLWASFLVQRGYCGNHFWYRGVNCGGPVGIIFW